MSNKSIAIYFHCYKRIFMVFSKLKYINLLMLLILNLNSSIGQNILLYKQPTVEQFKKYEIGLHSSFKIPDPKNKFLITEDYLPNANKYNLLQPISFTRRQSWIIPRCVVSYYFTEKDTVVKLINYDATKHSDSEIEKIKDKNLFEKLYSEITNELGSPIRGGPEAVVTDYGAPGIMTEHRIKWRKDNTNVELIMSWRKNDAILWVRIKVYWL